MAELDARLRDDLKAAAFAAGARQASLDELAVLLADRVRVVPGPFSTTLHPLTPTGKPAMAADGSPLSLTAFVQTYLDTHPHHRQR